MYKVQNYKSRETNSMKNPIVLDMTKKEVNDVWESCKQSMDDLVESNGENMFAAMGADPGGVNCPFCWEDHWRIGKLHKCTKCHKIYITNWWPMYSWGCSAADMETVRQKKCSQEIFQRLKELQERRMPHPAYRWGYEHPVGSPWIERKKQPWDKILDPRNYVFEVIKEIY